MFAPLRTAARRLRISGTVVQPGQVSEAVQRDLRMPVLTLAVLLTRSQPASFCSANLSALRRSNVLSFLSWGLADCAWQCR